MKRFVVYIFSGLILVLCSCKSLPSKESNLPGYDFKFDLYSHVKWYYRANLKYPSIEELYDYCWGIVNDANGNKYASFNDFEKATQKNVTGRESLLHHLSLYKDDISFEKKDKSMDILWKGKKWMKIKIELCEMIKEKSYLFTYFYKSPNNYSKDFNYEESFLSVKKEIRDKYLTDSVQRGKLQTCLLRYDRDEGYQVFYPSGNRLNSNAYLSKLGCALDTFLLNRDIQMIQFVTNLPEHCLIKNK